MPFGDTQGYILVVAAMMIAMFAQSRVQGTYAKYSQVQARSGQTGADVARDILYRAGLDQVKVEMVEGRLSDHYDPRARVVRLSREVFAGRSLAAFGIAAHETGHALQHHESYAPLAVRGAILPVVSIGSKMAFPLFLIGMLMSFNPLMNAGILLFSAVVFFQLVTLPVEFNASNRAVELLDSGGYITGDEAGPVKQMLRAAGFTYLAATAVALANLARLLLLRNSRRR